MRGEECVLAPTMPDAKTPNAPCYCLRTWSSCSMISATGSWCASSRTSFHRRAHSGRWRSVRGRGKSHNHRIFGGAAGCGRRACPERRRRREQQESAATAQRASEDRVDALTTVRDWRVRPPPRPLGSGFCSGRSRIRCFMKVPAPWRTPQSPKPFRGQKQLTRPFKN